MDQVWAQLIPATNPAKVYSEIEIPVTKPCFEKYDALVAKGAVMWAAPSYLRLTPPKKRSSFMQNSSATTFSDYEQVIRQLAPDESYDSFLCALLKTEILKTAEHCHDR